jgi:hypothetical protein
MAQWQHLPADVRQAIQAGEIDDGLLEQALFEGAHVVEDQPRGTLDPRLPLLQLFLQSLLPWNNIDTHGGADAQRERDQG